MSKPWIDSSVSAWTISPPSSSRAGRALGGERHELARREARARAASRASTVPTAPVAPTTATRRLMRALEGVLGRSDVVGAELERLVQRAHGVRDAVGARSTQEILIGEVEIISMLMSSSPSVANTFAATPGWRLMPAPTTDTFPIVGSSATADDADARRRPGRARARAVAQVGARDREGHVGATRPRDSGSFWMIMSTLTFGVGERGEDAARRCPGWSGTPSERHARLVGGVGDGGDQRSFHGLFLADDKGTGVLAEARTGTWMRTPWLRAYSTERSCSTRAPEAAISSISSKRDDGQLARVGHDPRVGAEDAGDVGVDLAHLGVHARRRARPRWCRSRRGRAS